MKSTTMRRTQTTSTSVRHSRPQRLVHASTCYISINHTWLVRARACYIHSSIHQYMARIGWFMQGPATYMHASMQQCMTRNAACRHTCSRVAGLHGQNHATTSSTFLAYGQNPEASTMRIAIAYAPPSQALWRETRGEHILVSDTIPLADSRAYRQRPLRYSS